MAQFFDKNRIKENQKIVASQKYSHNLFTISLNLVKLGSPFCGDVATIFCYFTIFYCFCQAIKDLRSLIGDHDLDHFFRDRELIAITSENDRYLLNFWAPRSRSYVRAVDMGFPF